MHLCANLVLNYKFGIEQNKRAWKSWPKIDGKFQYTRWRQLPTVCKVASYALVQSRQRGLFGGEVKALFRLPKAYSSLLPISQNKIVEYTWVPSFRRHRRAPATTPRNPSQHHYRHIDTNLTIFMTLAQNSKEDEDYLSMLWTTDPLQFPNRITKASENHSYIALQPRAHFREPRQIIVISLSHKIIKPGLNMHKVENCIQSSYLSLNWFEQCFNSCQYVHYLASSPGPSPEERPGRHCLCMREISCYIFVKSFVHYLVCMRKIILTKNTELSLTDSSDDLTYRTLLRFYFSDVAVSFFLTYSPTER